MFTSEYPFNIAQAPSAQLATAFPLSWSQYVFLLGIQNDGERRFKEIEAAQSSWSLPELMRQFDSSLYERLALSRDKDEVRWEEGSSARSSPFPLVLKAKGYGPKTVRPPTFSSSILNHSPWWLFLMKINVAGTILG